MRGDGVEHWTTVWVHFAGYGWMEGVLDGDGCLRTMVEPPVEQGAKIMCVYRVEGEPPPTPVETAWLLTARPKEDHA
jgi:hypothetical protein